MSTVKDPSLYVLLDLVPFIYLLDKEMEEGALEQLVAEATADKDTITESPAEMVAQAKAHLVPLRDKLSEDSVTKLRAIVKDDFALPGYSRAGKQELVKLLITLDLEERSRLVTLEAERVAREKAAAERLKAIAAGADAPAPRPAREPVEMKRVVDLDPSDPVAGWPALHMIKEIEVLKLFWLPARAGKKQEKAVASSVAKSLYREDIMRVIYNHALAREERNPGFLDDHIKIVALHK